MEGALGIASLTFSPSLPPSCFSFSLSLSLILSFSLFISPSSWSIHETDRPSASGPASLAFSTSHRFLLSPTRPLFLAPLA